MASGVTVHGQAGIHILLFAGIYRAAKPPHFYNISWDDAAARAHTHALHRATHARSSSTRRLPRSFAGAWGLHFPPAPHLATAPAALSLQLPLAAHYIGGCVSCSLATALPPFAGHRLRTDTCTRTRTRLNLHPCRACVFTLPLPTPPLPFFSSACYIPDIRVPHPSTTAGTTLPSLRRATPARLV